MRITDLPIEAAISRARGSSPFSGDGAVQHCLADELERMRHWLRSHQSQVAGINELDLYELARRSLAEGTLTEAGKEFWPEHLR